MKTRLFQLLTFLLVSGVLGDQFQVISEVNNSEASDLSADDIDPSKCFVFGPGLTPAKIVLPARYFFIQLVTKDGTNVTSLDQFQEDLLKIRIDCDGERQVWTQVLNLRDGSFIVRYKSYHSCSTGFRIIVTYDKKHLAESPYAIKNPVHPDNCNCPKFESAQWTRRVNCRAPPAQIHQDLQQFTGVDFKSVLKEAIRRYHEPGSHSFCHYVIKENVIYRKCYGQHVGFHIFPDAILLSLTRKMYLPDLEFLINLGDWPLVDINRDEKPIPIFSWCKRKATADILLPTYEITEASLEAMGRVSLDIMTAMANSDVSWEKKIEKAFWRGRDSRQERLDLVLLGRKFPDLINASLTNFFFFRDKMEVYGPKANYTSFFRFFDYKFQLNIDGTVAAYRFPFLLAGDSVVLKVDSGYYEHFYHQLQPWHHYIPVAADLSDLVERIIWLKEHDEAARRISRAGRKFVQENLMPLDILCYHAQVFNEWSTRLESPVAVSQDMELVKQPDLPRGLTCDCAPVLRHSQHEDDDDSDKDEL